MVKWYPCFNFAKMKSIKVRFNLGRGKNYMKWKVMYPDKPSEYLDPSQVQLVMTDCRLRNNRRTAEKIMSGQHKTVCAWVLCESIELKTDAYYTVDDMVSLKYNPRVTPNWVYEGTSGPMNVDNIYFRSVVSDGKKLFCKL